MVNHIIELLFKFSIDNEKEIEKMQQIRILDFLLIHITLTDFSLILFEIVLILWMTLFKVSCVIIVVRELQGELSTKKDGKILTNSSQLIFRCRFQTFEVYRPNLYGTSLFWPLNLVTQPQDNPRGKISEKYHIKPLKS